MSSSRRPLSLTAAAAAPALLPSSNAAHLSVPVRLSFRAFVSSSAPAFFSRNGRTAAANNTSAQDFWDGTHRITPQRYSGTSDYEEQFRQGTGGGNFGNGSSSSSNSSANTNTTSLRKERKNRRLGGGMGSSFNPDLPDNAPINMDPKSPCFNPPRNFKLRSLHSHKERYQGLGVDSNKDPQSNNSPTSFGGDFPPGADPRGGYGDFLSRNKNEPLGPNLNGPSFRGPDDYHQQLQNFHQTGDPNNAGNNAQTKFTMPDLQRYQMSVAPGLEILLERELKDVVSGGFPVLQIKRKKGSVECVGPPEVREKYEF